MSLILSVAVRRTYDAMKQRPGANSRESDARDPALLQAIHERILQLIHGYRLNEQRSANGTIFVFWVEIGREVDNGAFDDLLDRL